MFCRNCGTKNAEGIQTCTACGAELTNPYQAGSMQAQPPQATAPAGDKPDNFLVWAILCAICCCPICGIVGIVYAAQVDSKWVSGDHVGAISAAQNAKTWTLIGAGIGALLTLVQVVIAIGGIAAGG